MTNTDVADAPKGSAMGCLGNLAGWFLVAVFVMAFAVVAEHVSYRLDRIECAVGLPVTAHPLPAPPKSRKPRDCTAILQGRRP